MADTKNYSIAVNYSLYTIENGNKELEEQTTPDTPFRFLSGFGMTLDAFEKNVVDLNVGDDFDFTLSLDEGYGEHVDERVIELDREMFCIEGKFDHENVFDGAIIPLQNADGQRFYGQVVGINDQKVTVDLNHPLAGKELNFVGSVTEKREATNAEIQAMIAHLTGEGGCGGGCGGCGGGCNGGCKNNEGSCEGGCGSCGK